MKPGVPVKKKKNSMPFKKVGKNKNVSPSGRVFTDDQVKLYYATDGFKKSKLNKANRKSRGKKRK
jgi:hypothetical protein